MAVCACGLEWPLGLFEVLARNRQSAVGLSSCTVRAPEKPTRMFTIPPRQGLSVTIWLAIRTWNPPHALKTHKKACNTYTNTQRERQTQTRAHETFRLTIFFSPVVLQKAHNLLQKKSFPKRAFSLSLRKRMSDSALSSSGTGGLGTVMLAVPSKKVRRLVVLLFLPVFSYFSLRARIGTKGHPYKRMFCSDTSRAVF